MRLQATVEGFSVAAISYYVVGLLGYLIKAEHESALVPFNPTYLTAAAVPIVVLAIWWVVRRIRRRHISAAE